MQGKAKVLQRKLILNVKFYSEGIAGLLRHPVQRPSFNFRVNPCLFCVLACAALFSDRQNLRGSLCLTIEVLN